MSNETEMSILQHLDELRRRVMVAAIGLAIGVAVGTALANPALRLLVAPLQGQVPLAISPTEAPAVFFKVSVLIGVVFAMPVIMFQVFQFVRPGLERREIRYVLIGTPVASLSFAAGVAFAGLVLLPASMPFLQTFLYGIVEQRYTIENYVSFVSTIMLVAGLVFETPLVMYFLAQLGVVTPEGFAKARRVVIIGAAGGAAIITPTTDPVNMLLIMIPFMLLYEFGILLAKASSRQRR